MSETNLTRRALLKLGLAAGLAVGSAPRASAAPIVLRVSSSLTADDNSPHFVWFDRFRVVLKSKVGDAISLAYFPNNQLGKEADIVQQVRLGAVDMMVAGSSIWATILPEIGVLDLGYVYSGWGHVGRALDGTAGQTLATMLAAKGAVRILGYTFNFGARSVYSRNPILTVADLHGVKVRVLPVPNFMGTLKAMGAVPIPIPFGEVYTALQTGVVDALEQEASVVLAGKFYEIAKHCALTRHIYVSSIPVINSRSLERIPSNLRASFLAAAQEATAYQRGRAGESDARAFTELKKRGVTVSEIDMSATRERMEKFWNEFLTQYPAAKPLLAAIRAAA
jgi:tripartite ATP-independent transporter DctP family solute receptor